MPSHHQDKDNFLYPHSRFHGEFSPKNVVRELGIGNN